MDELCPTCNQSVDESGWCTTCQNYISAEAEMDDYISDLMERDD